MSFPTLVTLSDRDCYDTYTTRPSGLVVGTPALTVDNRKYILSLAAGDLDDLARLVVNSSICPGATGGDGYEGSLYADAAAGAQYVDIADTTARAVDYYQGAYLTIFPTGGPYATYRITGNDLGNGSTHVRCYLATPLENALTTSSGITAYRNPYVAVKAAADYDPAAGYAAFIGLPQCAVTSGSYFWLLVAGPAWVTAQGGTWPGYVVNERDVYAHQDGTIDPASIKDPSVGYQRVGYLLSGTYAAYGDAFIMLQLG